MCVCAACLLHCSFSTHAVRAHGAALSASLPPATTHLRGAIVAAAGCEATLILTLDMGPQVASVGTSTCSTAFQLQSSQVPMDLHFA